MNAYAHLQGEVDTSKTKVGWYKSMVSAVMPDRPLIYLFITEGFSVARPPLEQLVSGLEFISNPENNYPIPDTWPQQAA